MSVPRWGSPRLRGREVPPRAKTWQAQSATKERIDPSTGPNGESGPEAARMTARAKTWQAQSATKERIDPSTGPNGESGPEADR
jgi:hypothetical protein